MNRFLLCDDICGRSRFIWHQLTFALGCLASISRRGLHSYGLAIGWALLSVFAGPIQAESADDRPFGEMVGLNVKFSQGEPQSALPLLRELKVKWVRDTVPWPEMESAPDQYGDFPEAFQERLKFYKNNGIGVIFGLWYDNPKAYPNTPENSGHSIDAKAYGRYAVEIAKLLKASGVRFVLEIWNEPHNFVIRPLLGGEWNARPPSPWVDHYVEMVREAVTQVKSFDPKIELLDDDDMWVIHYWFLEKGLPRRLDGIAFHPYVNNAPEIAAVDQDTEWAKPFTLVDADGSFRSAVRRLREQSRLKMGTEPSMWITEWGWPVGGPLPNGTISEETVAAFLPRAFIGAAASGVRVLCWFSSRDSVDGPMGLTSNEGKHRKAFGAFRTMTEQIGDFVFDRQLVGQDNPTSGIQAYLFRGPQGNKLVVWSVDEKIPVILGGSEGSAIRANDVQGKAIAANADADGRVRLVVGAEPLYVSGIAGEVSIKPIPQAPKAPTNLRKENGS